MKLTQFQHKANQLGTFFVLNHVLCELRGEVKGEARIFLQAVY